MAKIDEGMGLVEAIRVGSKIRPQVFDAFFEQLDEPDKVKYGSCVLGAAWEAKKGRFPGRDYRENFDEGDVMAAFPNVDFAMRMQHPISEDMADMSLLWVILDLSDNRLWSREAIADWVENALREE